ncbi:MAG: tetratricopeptide repeat protein [Nannocystales bacterium]
MGTVSRLKLRLKNLGSRKIAVIVGAPLSLTKGDVDSGIPDMGVPDVSGMIERIRRRVLTEGLELAAAFGEVPRDDYSAAFRFVGETLGADVVNKIVRDAVLEARVASAPLDFQDDGDPEHWHLPAGTVGLARWVALLGRQCDVVLTTNFDPLLSLAIAAAGGVADRTVLATDGRLPGQADSRAGTRVVHVHGYWRDSDTLHTPEHMRAGRPQLGGSLRTLLRDHVVLVCACGGWDDALMRSLKELLDEPSAERIDVLWAHFDHERDVSRLAADFFEKPSNPRVVDYFGVNAHELFSELAEETRALPGAGAASSKAPVSAPRVPASGISNLPRPASSCVGRDTDAQRIREALDQRRAKHGRGVAALTGMPGLGKTRLAYEFAHRGESQYKVRWLVEAESESSAMHDLAALASELGVAHGSLDVDVAVERTLAWLAANDDWLLLLDNARDQESVRRLIPDSPRGDVLITSQATAWRGLAEPVPLNPLSVGVAVSFLSERSGKEADGSALKIAEVLGGVPLALVQAAAYVEATGCSFSDYVQALREVGPSLFDAAASRLDTPTTVNTTFQLCLGKVQEQDPQASCLLELLAFLDPNGVPQGVLAESATWLPPGTEGLWTTRARLDAAKAVLRRFSLIDQVGESLCVHRLVQFCVREGLLPERRRNLESALLHWACSVFAYQPGSSQLEEVQRGVPEQVHALFVEPRTFRSPLRETLTLLSRLGTFEMRRGAVSAAASVIRSALQLSEERVALDPEGFQARRDLAVALERLGDVDLRSGAVAEGKVCYERSLSIREQQLGLEPGDSGSKRGLSVVLSKLGGAQLCSGDGLSARTCYHRALAIAEELAELDPGNAEFQQDLSALFHRFGDLEAREGNAGPARTCRERALDISEGLLRANPQNTRLRGDLSFSLTKLGDTELREGNGARARESYERSLEIREGLAKSDPGNAEAKRAVGVALTKLGDMEGQVGNPATARTHHKAALRISEELAELDVRNASAKGDMAGALGRMGDSESQIGSAAKARDYYEKALAVCEERLLLQPGSVEAKRGLFVALVHLGDVELGIGSVAMARERYTRALDISQELATLDTSSADAKRDVSSSLGKLGQVERAAGLVPAARAYYERALTMCDKLAHSDTRNVEAKRSLVVALTHLAGLELEAGMVTAASAYYERSLAVCTGLARANPDSGLAKRDLMLTMEPLADVKGREGDHARARELLEGAVELAEELVTLDPESLEARRDLSAELTRLADLLVRIGNAAGAGDCYERALKLREKLAASEPDNPRARLDLSVSLGKNGDIAARLGNDDAARTYYERALDILAPLTASDLLGPSAKSDLAVVLHRVGGVELRAKNCDGARRYYERGVRVLEDSFRAESGNGKTPRSLVVLLIQLGDVETRAGNEKRAREHWGRAFVIAEDLVKSDPGNAKAQRELAIVAARLGDAA